MLFFFPDGGCARPGLCPAKKRTSTCRFYTLKGCVTTHAITIRAIPAETNVPEPGSTGLVIKKRFTNGVDEECEGHREMRR